MLAIAAAPQAQAPAPAAETLDTAMIAKIREEGLKRSQVMDHISWLSDVYGPRLTGGPGIMQASEWALKKFSEWGLANGHREPFAFGKGWTLERFSAHLIEPQIEPLIGFPGAWTPGTNGPVTADVILAQIATEADFQKFRGKLKDKIVLTQPKRAVRMLEGPFVLRMTEPEFAEAATVPAPAAGRGAAAGRGTGAGRGAGRGDAVSFAQKLQQFYKDEGVVALFNRGGDSDTAAGGSDLSWRQQRPDGGTIFPTGSGSRGADAGTGLPTVTLAVEHYNRMVRVLDEESPGQGRAQHPDAIPRRDDAERFQRHRGAAGERPGTEGRSRPARRALRLGRRRHRRHRQRHRLGGHDGSAAHPQDCRCEAAADDPDRAVGRRRAGAAGVARPTSSSTSAASRPGRCCRTTRISRSTSIPTTAPAASVASGCRATRRPSRSSASG